MTAANAPRRPAPPSLLASLAAGASAAAGLSLARSAHAAGSDVLKVALIGCGGRGIGAGRDALEASPRVRITALADAFEHRVQAANTMLTDRYKERCNVPADRCFSGLDCYRGAMETDADLVALCGPPGFRPVQYEAAVKAGKHVFMEKPLACDAPGVRRILAANESAKSQGLAVAVGHHLRHEDKHRELIARIHDGAIGDVKLIRVYFNTGPLWVRTRQPDQNELQYQVNNWYYFTWLSGDHIVEQHVHDLDVGNWVMKDKHPVEANGMGGREVRKGPQHGDIYDHHSVEFTYADGTKMFSFCRQIRGCWNAFSEHVHGTRGRADMEGHGNTALYADGQPPVTWRRERDGHLVEWEDLIAALEQGEAYNECDHTARSTMTAILGRMATSSGKVVTWDEALGSNRLLAADLHSWDDPAPVQPLADGNYPVAVPGVTKAW